MWARSRCMCRSISGSRCAGGTPTSSGGASLGCGGRRPAVAGRDATRPRPTTRTQRVACGALTHTRRAPTPVTRSSSTAPKPFSGPISRVSGVRRVYVLFRDDAGKVVGYVDRLGFTGTVNLSTLTQRNFYVAMDGNDDDSGTLGRVDPGDRTPSPSRNRT